MLNTILVIIGVIAILAVAYYIIWKKGKIEDAAGKVKKVAKEVKRRGKNVKKELKDVVNAAKEVGNQIGDVGAAAKGKKRQGRRKKK